MHPTKPRIGIFDPGITNWLLWLLVLSGAVIRFWYGVRSVPWYIAPDQLAWQMGIDEMLSSGNWSLLQLGHAPHEGGSAMIGLLSILLRPIDMWLPPLSFAALVVDTLIRLWQIKIAQQLFGSATAAWFGLWTVLSVPLLLSWSVVNTGLHYPASIFPFIFFWLIAVYREHLRLPLWLGLCCGLGISFAYENCLLLLPALAVVWHAGNRWRPVLALVMVTAVCAIPHILIRLWADAGYPVENGVLSSRLSGMGGILHPGHLLTIWFTVLPASLVLPANTVEMILAFLMVILVAAGMICFVRNNKQPWRWLPVTFLLLYVVVYALGPFSANSTPSSSYMVYRHLAYIIPLLVLLLINGFVHSNLKTYLLGAWFLCCGIASVIHLQRTYNEQQPAYRAAGWILVQKYGADIPQLFRLQTVTDTAYHHSLAMGFGWGLAAAILRSPNDTTAVARLRSLIVQSPLAFQDDMRKGVGLAFAPGVTPVLPAASLQLFKEDR